MGSELGINKTTTAISHTHTPASFPVRRAQIYSRSGEHVAQPLFLLFLGMMGDVVQEGVESHFHTIAHSEVLNQTREKAGGSRRSKHNKPNLLPSCVHSWTLILCRLQPSPCTSHR